MSEFSDLADFITKGPKHCCKTKQGEPHEETCRYSPKGMVIRFRQQLAASLQTCVDEGVLSASDSVEQAVAKLNGS